MNYVLWGMVMSAINVGLGRAIQIASLWKVGKWAFVGGPHSCRPSFQRTASLVQWIVMGYAMYDAWFWKTVNSVFNANRSM